MNHKSLNKARIKYVQSLSLSEKATILYKFLVEGLSMRAIEKSISNPIGNGWGPFYVTRFYGFDNTDKNSAKNFSLKDLEIDLSNLDEEDIEEFHLNLSNGTLKEDKFTYNETNINDGTDKFAKLKQRIGQSKLRAATLKNYNCKCALCNINDEKLLITSHIKHWSASIPKERMDESNAILLCKLHDALFENGYIYFDDNLNVLFNKSIDFKTQGINTNLIFKFPKKCMPKKEYLQWHRKKHKLE